MKGEFAAKSTSGRRGKIRGVRSVDTIGLSPGYRWWTVEKSHGDVPRFDTISPYVIRNKNVGEVRFLFLPGNECVRFLDLTSLSLSLSLFCSLTLWFCIFVCSYLSSSCV